MYMDEKEIRKVENTLQNNFNFLSKISRNITFKQETSSVQRNKKQLGWF